MSEDKIETKAEFANRVFEHCNTIFRNSVTDYGNLIDLAWFTIVAAIVIAIAYAVAELIIKWNASKQPPVETEVKIDADGKRSESLAPVSPEFLKALGELFGKLTSAPVWFFLYVAGIALIFLADIQTPNICKSALGLDTSGENETNTANGRTEPNSTS